MAANDSANQTGNDAIATNVLATVNGTAVTGIEAQRVKVGHGVDGAYLDASSASPLPSATPNVVTTGTITAANANLTTGTATAGSTVVHTVGDAHAAFAVELGGTFSATTTLVVMASVDGTTWHPTVVRPNLGVGVAEQYTITTTDISGGPTYNPSLWKGNSAGVGYLRVTCSAYTAADAVTVRILSSAGTGAVFLTAGITDVRGAQVTGSTGAIGAGATGTVGPVDVSRAGNVSFIVKNTIAGTPWTGAPVLVFEQSDDNTSWAPFQVVNNATGAVATTHTLAANTANTEVILEAAVEAVGYARVRVTTAPATAGMTINIQVGSLGFNPLISTTDRKDAARTSVSLYAVNVTAGTSGTEALVSLTPARGVVVSAAAGTFAITAGKTLRLTGIRFRHVAGTTTTNSAVWRLRVNTGGAVTATTGAITVSASTRAAATTGATDVYDIPIGEGYEIPNTTGTTNIGVTVTPTWSTTALTYDVHLVGYEY
jgi:hypothetical protein